MPSARFPVAIDGAIYRLAYKQAETAETAFESAWSQFPVFDHLAPRWMVSPESCSPSTHFFYTCLHFMTINCSLHEACTV